MKTILRSGNIIELVDNLDRFQQCWPFFKEGLDKMNNLAGTRMIENEMVYLRIMLQMCTNFPNGVIVVETSKNGKLLGYSCGYNATSDYADTKTFHVYGLYSNGKHACVTQDLLSWCKDFCRDNQYTRITCQTGRINGASFRFFEQKLGFKRQALTFNMELN